MRTTLPPAARTLLGVGLGLAILALASSLRGRSVSSTERTVKAGPATLAIPRFLAPEVRLGTDRRGAIVLGEMDEREICYEQFLSVHWSDREIADAELVPAPAYQWVDKIDEPLLLVKEGREAHRVLVLLTARKPCGKIVHASLEIIRTSCERTGMHLAITALLDPVLTPEKLAAIARGLTCT